MVKFCVYHCFGGCYSYSNLTNYFKMNNYCKFYGKTVIFTTAVMHDNLELPGYADFTCEVFCHLTRVEDTTVSC